MAAATAGLGAQDAVPPSVPGTLRNGLDARVRGEALVRELGCANCHRRAGEEPARTGPSLAGLGARVDPNSLQWWLTDPRAAKPGTSMPHTAPGLDENRDAAQATLLAGWLLETTGGGFRRTTTDAEAAARGRESFQSIGCAACHAPRDEDGSELALTDSVPLGDLGAKYSVKSLREFLLDPHRTRPERGMPDFDLNPLEANDLAYRETERFFVVEEIETEEGLVLTGVKQAQLPGD